MSSSAFTPKTNIANAASPSNEGFVSTGAQTFGGDKTFNGTTTIGTALSGTTHVVNGALEIASDTALTTGGWISSARGTLANAATTSISNGTSGYNGLLIVTTSEGYTAQFVLGGTLNTVTEVSDPSSTFTTTAANANTVNVYYASPNYRVQNNRSSSTITVMFLGGPGRIHL